MTVRLLFFASLRESVGEDALDLPLAEATDLQSLFQRLEGRIPTAGLAALQGENVRIALNQTLVNGPFIVQPGDELAFLPPVTGG